LPALKPSAEPTFVHDRAYVEKVLIQQASADNKGLPSVPQQSSPSDSSFDEEKFSAFLKNPTEDPGKACPREVSSKLPAIADIFYANFARGRTTPAPATMRPRIGRVRAPKQEIQDETPVKRRK